MTNPRRLLFIDDDADFLTGMRMQLGGSYGLITAQSIAEGLALLENHDVDLVMLDVGLGEEDGLAGIKRIHNVHPSVGIAMLSGRRDTKTVVRAIRAGAIDYLTKPVGTEELAEVVEKAVATRDAQERREALWRVQNCAAPGEFSIVFRSRGMRSVIEEADRVRNHSANVLIVGNTGTGKELVARYVNKCTNGGKRPFVAVNCAAIPEHLLESELFGHEAGAFTGANRRRIGKFEIADGGDIFLDEVSTMKLDLQVKLLRVLQEKEFCRLGSNTPIKTDFRVISACNQPLDPLLEKGSFRADLYHRLRVMEINVPQLCERVEDIPVLVEHFLEKYAAGGKRKTVADTAMARLMEHTWPGNVRELENVVHTLMIYTQGELIDESAFPPWLMNTGGVTATVGAVSAADANQPSVATATYRDYVQDAERRFIQYTLDSNSGDKSKTARALNMGRTTLYMKLRELGLM